MSAVSRRRDCEASPPGAAARPRNAGGRCNGCLALLVAEPAHAALSAEELAKLAQNPVGNLISLPLQNNTNLNFGPEKGTQKILNIQPAVPISISCEWNIITRTIVPTIRNPSLGPRRA